ncbi:MAG: hypothetical protein CM1200mP1_07900 [Candidatus Neomarinimicrobiota bacterium]|nr:MAG: hypothetical protein CM1200mP1_07900 [Candidatus Neomarinimicrobiota bacterium]
MRIIKETHINFMRQRKMTSILSLAIILTGVVSLVINNGPKTQYRF